MDTPAGSGLRPTTALVRKALFDILGDRVRGARMVDLYAGAGTVSFEALSRGARSVTAVERDGALAALMRSTAARLGCADRLQVVAADVQRWAASRGVELEAADLVFLDAPYRDDTVAAVLASLGSSPPALAVCEHHRARHLPERIGGLRVVRSSTYGATQLTFLARTAAAETAEEPVPEMPQSTRRRVRAQP